MCKNNQECKLFYVEITEFEKNESDTNKNKFWYNFTPVNERP
jgi:hypothetical protein